MSNKMEVLHLEVAMFRIVIKIDSNFPSHKINQFSFLTSILLATKYKNFICNYDLKLQFVIKVAKKSTSSGHNLESESKSVRPSRK